MLDGLYIVNGDATGQDKKTLDYKALSSESTAADAVKMFWHDAYWPQSYGGGAIVPSYAHIRNCIVKDNNAKSGGGGLMLKPQALVSGCIIRNNTTSGDGGGIYVFEPSKRVAAAYPSEATDYVNPASGDINRPAVAGPDYPYANIFTSTIAGNTAENKGGGVAFTTNLRMNSSVLWRNSANSYANLSGTYSPTAEATMDMPWEYPLQVCAVENLRAPGFNNLSVATLSSRGTRWASERSLKNDDIGLLADENEKFELRRYSQLCRMGMRQDDWDALRMGYPVPTGGASAVSRRVVGAEGSGSGTSASPYIYWPTLEAADIANVDRTAIEADLRIEIGAREYQGQVIGDVEPNCLLRRLYVVQPKDTDNEYMQSMYESGNAYYSQAGSSMAYPMNTLGHALEYVRNARMLAKDNPTANYSDEIANAQFEIFVGPGTFYPQLPLKGVYETTRSNTFLVPEGVAIYGGMDPTVSSLAPLKGFDGYDTDGNTLTNTPAPTSGFTAGGLTVGEYTTPTLLNGREKYDANQNGIVEGWGMKNQTVLSGNVNNNEDSSNVFHVVTCIAADEYVGQLPTLKETITGTFDGSKHMGKGKAIILDGLQITNGYAKKYDSAVLSTSTYYKGGAILVDGNRTTQDGDDYHMEKDIDGYDGYVTNDYESHAKARRTRGYRNIPLVIRNCHIFNNKASFGGAISSNGTLEIYSSQLAQNSVEMRSEAVNLGGAEYTLTYAGRGGAVEANGDLTVVNSIFANNSALSPDNMDDIDGDKKRANGTGGAVTLGEYSTLHMLNCDVVRNEATAYPAIFSFNLNKGYTSASEAGTTLVANNPIKIVNTIFWGNNNVHPATHGSNKHAFNLVLNPYTEEPTDGVADLGTYPESLWFCAYEDGVWRKPKSITNQSLDFCAMKYADDKEYGTGVKFKYIPSVIDYQLRNDTELKKKDVTHPDEGGYMIYNFNLHINSDNDQPDGPNFVMPSSKAGYDGYESGADWMLSRINTLVDRGWAKLNQKADANGDMHFVTKENTDDAEEFEAKYSTVGYEGQGLYYYVRENLDSALDKASSLPIGTEPYMYYNLYDDTLTRISLDPNPTHEKTYIDIGAYEYQHMQLHPATTKLVDILWVTTKESQEQTSDGSTPKKATSDLQRAIETLLASRNDHHKEIRLIQGDYFPIYTLDDNQAFTINTDYLNKYTNIPLSDADPGYLEDKDKYGVLTLTIRGGYSSDGSFDLRNNSSLLCMPNGDSNATDKLFQHVLIVEHAENFETSTAKVHTATNRVIPIIIEAVNFKNPSADWHKDEELNNKPGGAAITYKPQKQVDGIVGTNVTYKTDLVPDYTGYDFSWTGEGTEPYLTSLPKLAIKNCKFYQNGASTTATKQVPTVTIGKGGGDALIFNSLFADNNGPSLVAADTKVVNCTFANNVDGVILDADSHIYNSILWNNGETEYRGFTTDERFNILDAASTILADNIKRNSIQMEMETGVKENNFELGAVNDDFKTGPNFVNPTNTEVASRDYSIRPGKQVYNKGGDDKSFATSTPDIDYYKTYVLTVMNPVTPTKKMTEGYDFYYSIDDEDPSSPVVAPEGDTPAYHYQQYLLYRDLAGNLRLYDDNIDTGAYESQAKLQRVSYVRPPETKSGDGSSWENAYGGDELQSAINAAGLWADTHTPRKAYVFVRGNNDKLMDKIQLSENVEVYGSLMPNYTGEAARDANGDVDDDNADAYLLEVRTLEDRSMAAPTANLSMIQGVTCTDPGALIDGFDIYTNDETTTEPPVYINGGSANGTGSAVRNCIIHNFNMVDAPVVKLQGKALLYNSLVRDVTLRNGTESISPSVPVPGVDYAENLLPAAVEADVDSYVVNTTVCGTVGGTTTTGYSLIKNDALANSIKNISYLGKPTADDAPFAPYFQSKPGFFYQGTDRYQHFSTNRNLWYQLGEQAEAIDNGADPSYDTNWIGDYINYNSDRDLLGNPRKISSYVDNGGFETWTTGRYDAESAIVLHADRKTDQATFGEVTVTYPKNNYPHQGSVVYLQRGGTMVLDKAQFTNDHPFNPGYLLLREGGSLYGQGNTVKLEYLTLQREITGNYAFVSLPFDFEFATGENRGAYTEEKPDDYEYPIKHLNLAPLAYDEHGGIYTNQGFDTENGKDKHPIGIYCYDGVTRAGSRFQGLKENSVCWNAYDITTPMPANTGFLLDFTNVEKVNIGEEEAKRQYVRFTTYAEAPIEGVYSYVYTEEPGVTERTVTLTQYDDRNWSTGAGNGISQQEGFTSEYNMGWNLIGVPYLISNYRTGEEESKSYNMHIPHVIYQYQYGDNAGYKNAEQSWDAGTTVSVGEAFFTQTATLKETEDVKFKMPEYVTEPTTQKLACKLAVAIGESAGDTVEIRPAEKGGLSYTFGSDGVKMLPLTEQDIQLYALSDTGMPMSLMSDAKMGVDIPLGLTTRAEGECTFSLPEAEAWECEVWLIDKLSGSTVNLLEEDYGAEVPAGVTNERFYVHFGSLQIEESHRMERKVYTRDGRLHIDGLNVGSVVGVFDTEGRCYHRGEASEPTLDIDLSHPGVYIIIEF